MNNELIKQIEAIGDTNLALHHPVAYEILKNTVDTFLSQSHQQGRMETVNKWLSLNLTNDNKENWDSELTKFGLYIQQIEQQSNPTHN